jgi:D-arabinose 1-dehydrogenase-like Zn-dependent alcohol dehydrogenase
VKALVLNAVGREFDFEDVDIAAPIGREVLVDVHASGLCHTDLLFAANPIFPTPAVFGHEVSGIVAETGPGVTQLRVGDHVVGSLAQSCGSCPRCQSGRSFQCQHPEATLRRSTDVPRLTRKGQALYQGLELLGGFAERALVHENQLALVPKEMPFAQAALLGCGVVTGAGARPEHRMRSRRGYRRDLRRRRRGAQRHQWRSHRRRVADCCYRYSAKAARSGQAVRRYRRHRFLRSQNLTKRSATFSREAPIMCSTSWG